MYDELIKALRETDFSDGCPCEAEPMCASADCLIAQATDAIEELLAERDEVNADSWKTAFEVERDEHRWIPVTEPPNNMRDVLVTAFWHENWQTLMGWYDGKWHVTANDQVREDLTVIAWQDKPLPASLGIYKKAEEGE